MNDFRYNRAYWLVYNTRLTYEQIANYCKILPLEVKAIADGVSQMCREGYDVIEYGELTLEEIKRCENDVLANLKPVNNFKIKKKTKSQVS